MERIFISYPTKRRRGGALGEEDTGGGAGSKYVHGAGIVYEATYICRENDKLVKLFMHRGRGNKRERPGEGG